MIKEIVTYSDIILYWDITDRKSEDMQYYVYLNGELVDKSNKTHITIRNVNTKTADVEIYIDKSKKELFYKKSFVMKDKPHFIDVTAEPYNAVGDGKTINTTTLQRAINDCKDKEALYFPKGVYLTGTLNLHSNMELYIDEDAVLQGTDNPEDYMPKIRSRFEGIEMECYSSLLNMWSTNSDTI